MLNPVELAPHNWKLLSTVVDAAPECIKVVARDGRLLLMNSTGLSMIGASSWNSVNGASTLDLVAPEDRHLWREFHTRVCDGANLTWQFDIIGLTGVRRRMETSAAPIALSDGSVGQLAFTRDITARSERERGQQQVTEALQETERTFELLISSVTDYAIFMLDPLGHVVNWNAGAQRIKGYAAGEIIGQHFSRFYTEEDQRADAPMTVLRTAAREGRVEKEGWRVRKDGSRFLANVIIDAIHDQGRLVGFAKITRDITEKKAAEVLLRQSQKMAAIGQFTGGAAHDFSNLLMAISGSLELLRKHLPRDRDAHLLKLLDNAAQASRRGISLTQRMLAFARRQELKVEPVDLVALVGGMTELLERSVGPRVRIETVIARDTPRVSTDANQLETALLNLVLNARDAMPEGGTITITAREAQADAGDPNSLSPGQYTVMAVRDTGTGMDEATLARVREPFFTTKGVGKGTGLGLAVVDGLTDQSGGKLVIRSRLHEGTTVELWLPVAKDVAADIVVAPQSAGTTPGSRSLQILVVDDDSLVLTSTTAMLEDLGHRVIAVSSAAQALEILRKDSVQMDLVITDQVMPTMTGLQLANAIKVRHAHLPVILASGFAELPRDTSSILQRIAKPFTQRQLAEVVALSASKS